MTDDKQLSFGTDPLFLYRSDSVDTSKQAAESVDTTRLEELVYNAIKSYGDRGCISDEVRNMFKNLPYSSITARYRSLLDKGYIVDTGERRKGKSGRTQRVMRYSKESFLL